MTFTPTPACNVVAAATALLTTVASAMTGIAGVSDWIDDTWALPNRQAYVPGSNVAWDAPQLVVNFMGMRPGTPGREQTQPILPVNILLFYDFEVTLLRQVPGLTGRGGQGGIPTPTKLSAGALTVETDNVLLTSALVQMHAAGAIVPVGIPFLYGSVDTVGPEGNLSGSHVSVSFQAGMSAVPGAY